jgi:hypothetical protein
LAGPNLGTLIGERSPDEICVGQSRGHLFRVSSSQIRVRDLVGELLGIQLVLEPLFPPAPSAPLPLKGRQVEAQKWQKKMALRTCSSRAHLASTHLSPVSPIAMKSSKK